jgi:hypothetical protein
MRYEGMTSAAAAIEWMMRKEGWKEGRACSET